MESLGDILKRVIENDTSPNTSRKEDAFQTAEPTPDVCNICQGLGWVQHDTPLGHPEFGEVFPCRCQQQDSQPERNRRLQKYSNLPDAMYKRMTFESFNHEGSMYADDQDRLTLNAALAAAKNFASTPEGWLLLAGPHGSGKTHLAVAIAGARINLGEVVFFSFVPDLLDHLRSTFHPDSQVDYDQLFDKVKSAPLLILDDLGSESSTAWVQEKLYQIIVYRHNFQLPTVITTYLKMEDIEKAQPRMASRFRDTMVVQWVPISAPDYRDQQRRKSSSRRNSPPA